MIFDTKIHGIPCQCEVTHYVPYTPANLNGHPDNWTPPEGGEFEFNILDRNGRSAPWLERYVTDKDNDRLYREFLDIVTKAQDHYFNIRLEDYENRCF